MIDLSSLLNYGILGLWTSTLLYDKFKRELKFLEALDQLNSAVQKLILKEVETVTLLKSLSRR